MSRGATVRSSAHGGAAADFVLAIGKSHKGTGFKPMKWKVPGTMKDGKQQSNYSLCACKYSKCLPYCDAIRTKRPWLRWLISNRAWPTDTSIPVEYSMRQKNCTESHVITKKHPMCTKCGYAPKRDFKIMSDGSLPVGDASEGDDDSEESDISSSSSSDMED